MLRFTLGTSPTGPDRPRAPFAALAGLASLAACAGIALAPAAIPQPQAATARDSANPRVTPIVQVVRKVGPTVVNLYADLEIDRR